MEVMLKFLEIPVPSDYNTTSRYRAVVAKKEDNVKKMYNIFS